MQIKKVHCFFEQSGMFKNEFIKLGIPAEDYDILNNFGETDHIVDLFQSIENAYDGKPSLFDYIGENDLIFAFFPCVYFCAPSQINFTWNSHNYRNLSFKEKSDEILKRSKKREIFYSYVIKLFTVISERGLRMIMENPWSENTFLKANFILPPTFVDYNRRLRGDNRVKPTAYWYVNCKPTYGRSFMKSKVKKTHMKSRKSIKAGMCSEERSIISPDYARNFICDFILGKELSYSELSFNF